jgi:large subunit ribosomal protein L5
MSADKAKGAKGAKGAKDAKDAKPKTSKAPAPQQAGAKKGTKEDKKAGFTPGERPKLPAGYVPRFQTHYSEKVVPALVKRFSYTNTMRIPKLTKIVINMGLGEAAANPRVIDSAVREIAAIAGQRPAVAKARKSISNFKLREGMPIGAFVTLRRATMWEFIDRLITMATPRIRDFRGLPDKGFDGRGNYTLGLKEHIIFPEIDIDAVDKIRGMDITFVTTAKTDQEAYELLRELGLPMRKREVKAATAA